MRAVGREFKKARNLFTNVLRAPNYDNASCLACTAGLIALFLCQVEPLLWRRGIFKVLETYEGEWPIELHPLSGFWLFPFEWVPPAERGSLWIFTVIVYLVNAVLIDRFVAKHGGTDVSFRLSILRLRRLLAGVPLLGLCVIPLWRVLSNRKPDWACQRTVRKLVLEGLQSDLPGLARPLPQGGAELHSVAFFLWILVSNLFALRAALACLNEPERATATSLLVIQGICGTLRIGGLICVVAYAKLRSRDGALWGKRKVGLLVCSGAWFLPQSLFLLSLLVLMLVGERWGTVTEDVQAHSTLEREADKSVGSRFLAVGRPLQSIVLDQAALKVLRLYREKTFLLMLEVASIMMLILPVRARFPWMNLPGCLVALIYLVALLSLPIGAVLYGRFLFRMFSASTEQARDQVEHPFARYLLLSSLAVVGGFNIGITAGAREMKTLAFLFFWIGAYGSIIVSFSAFWGLLKTNEKSLIIWPMLFLCIGMTGYQMQQGSVEIYMLGLSRHVENAAQFHLFKLYLMIPLVIVLSIFVGLYRCRWLLRPFRLKDIFNPLIPIWLRRQMGFLIVTACLPLGGVFVPAWIRLRVKLTEHPFPG